jgi:WD40 repeat protein
MFNKQKMWRPDIAKFLLALTLVPFCIAHSSQAEQPPRIRLVAQSGELGEARFVALSASGLLAATSDGTSHVCLWRVSDRALIWKAPLPPGYVRKLEIPPNQSYVLLVFEPFPTFNAGDAPPRSWPNMAALTIDTRSGRVRLRITGPPYGSDWIQIRKSDSALIISGLENAPHVIPASETGKIVFPSGIEGWSPIAIAANEKVIGIATSRNDLLLYSKAGVVKLAHSEKKLSAITFSRDAHLLAVGDELGTVKIWDLRATHSAREFVITGGPCPRSLPLCHAAQKLAFSPAGDLLAAATAEGKARLWSLSDPQLETDCDLPAWATLSFDSRHPKIRDLFFDHSGRYLFLQSERVVIFDAIRKSPSNPFAPALSRVLGIDQSTFEAGGLEGDSLPTAVAFAADTENAITSFNTYVDIDGVLIWGGWDTNITMRLSTHLSSLFGVIQSPNLQWLAAEHYNNVKLWDLQKGKIISSLQGPSAKPIMFSPDSKSLLLASRGIKIWHLDTDQLTQIPTTGAAAFSSNGDAVITLTREGTLDSWSTDGTNKHHVGDLGKIGPLARIAPIGPWLLGIQETESVRIVDQRTGLVNWKYGVSSGRNEEAVLADKGDVILVFPRTLELGSSYILVDAATGMEKARWPFSLTMPDRILMFAEKGREKLAMATVHGLVIHDLASGTEVLGSDVRVSDLAGFLPNCTCLVASDSDDGIRLVDTVTGQWKAQLFASARISDPSKWGPDFQTKVMRGGRSLVVEPSGRFDSDDFDSGAVSWVVADDPLNPLPVEDFMRDFYVPRLLNRIVEGSVHFGSNSLPKVNRLRPFVKISFIPPLTPDSKTVKVVVDAFESTKGSKRSGIYDLRLYRDGRLVREDPETYTASHGPTISAWRHAKKLSAREQSHVRRTYVVRVPNTAASKPVVFTSYAFNADRVKGETNRVVMPPSTRFNSRGNRTAYIIGIGIADNENPKLRLLYPVRDVRLVEQELIPRLRASKRYDNVQLVSLVSPREARDHEADDLLPTKSNIRGVFNLLNRRGEVPRTRAFDRLRQRIKQAGPDDTVLIFYSGHGEKSKNGAFTVFPFDTDTAVTSKHVITSIDFESWLRDVDAGEVVLILDSCHSGAVIGSNFRPAPLGDSGLGQMAYDKGMRILAATQPAGVELGSGIERNGLLTNRLLESGLHQRQASVGEEFDWSAWLMFGSKRTKYLDPELYDFSPEAAPR